MTRLLITGNCQRYALATQLAFWFSNWSIGVKEIPHGEISATLKESLLAQLKSADIWLAIDGAGLVQELRSQLRPETKVVCVPSIGFTAFHPDICFVSTDQGNPRPDPPFHSTIAIWAFQQGLTIEQTCTLYSAQNFSALGYFSAWNDSVDYLKAQFLKSDLAQYFEPFFLAIKRSGCFMHTFNHPKPGVVSLLCLYICQKLNISPTSNTLINETNCTLSAIDWPVYPEISAVLGITQGSYCWRLNQQWIPDLRTFIAEQFLLYQRWASLSTELKPLHRDIALLDKVLGSSSLGL